MPVTVAPALRSRGQYRPAGGPGRGPAGNAQLGGLTTLQGLTVTVPMVALLILAGPGRELQVLILSGCTCAHY